MAFLFGLILSIANAETCTEDELALFRTAKELFFIGKPEKSLETIKLIEQELHCNSLKSASFLGDLYLLKGANLYFLAQENMAQAYLTSASNLIAYDPVYGEDLSKAYHNPSLPIQLRWKTIENQTIWIDGKVETSPFSTTPSPHLLQLTKQDQLLYSQFIYPVQEQELILPDFSPPKSSKNRYLWAIPITASIFTISGFTLSKRHQETISSLNSKKELEDHLTLQKQFQAMNLGLLGTTIGSTLFVMVISSNSR